MMKVTANRSAETTTARGITASRAVSSGKNVSRMKIPATAKATLRLATPVAAASPTAGVDVFVPTAPASPATAVETPSASTPRVVEAISGRTQSASFIRWQTVIVPAAFIAAATDAIANGATRATSNDHDICPRDGIPTQGASRTADIMLL